MKINFLVTILIVIFVVSNNLKQKLMKNTTLTIGTLFQLTANTELRVNSNGSGVYPREFLSTNILKVEKINSKSVYCSIINCPSFGPKFKGIIMPIGTDIKILKK